MQHFICTTTDGNQFSTTNFKISFCFQDNKEKPEPAPRLHLNGVTYDLPELPPVPNLDFINPRETGGDDIDFDDLARRFNELKKKK